MKEKADKQRKKWITYLGNTYVIVLILFIVWMLFFDTNSYLIHSELDEDIVETFVKFRNPFCRLNKLVTTKQTIGSIQRDGDFLQLLLLLRCNRPKCVSSNHA